MNNDQKKDDARLVSLEKALPNKRSSGLVRRGLELLTAKTRTEQEDELKAILADSLLSSILKERVHQAQQLRDQVQKEKHQRQT